MKLCSTPGCPRPARLGWAVCNDCADRLLTQHEPEWVRRARENKLAAKDWTRAA